MNGSLRARFFTVTFLDNYEISNHSLTISMIFQHMMKKREQFPNPLGLLTEDY